VDKPSFEASLRALARRRAQEGHPEPSELAAYHAGELTEDQEEKIQDHLTICEECARLLLGFSEYSRFQPSKDMDAAAEDQSAAAWQRFQTRLREETEVALPPPTYEREVVAAADAGRVLQRERAFSRPRPWLPWTVAAALAVFVAGLGIQVRTLRPAAEMRFLSSVDVQSNVRSATEIKALPGDGILVLTPRDFFSEYEVEIAPQSGGDAVAGPIRGQADELGNLILYIPPSSLPEGVYVARTFGIRDGQRKTLDNYQFQISAAK
jgi:hypothetical protein